MSKIFSLTVIEERKKKRKLYFEIDSKKLNLDKTFDDIIKNELLLSWLWHCKN